MEIIELHPKGCACGGIRYLGADWATDTPRCRPNALTLVFVAEWRSRGLPKNLDELVEREKYAEN